MLVGKVEATHATAKARWWLTSNDCLPVTVLIALTFYPEGYPESPAAVPQVTVTLAQLGQSLSTAVETLNPLAEQRRGTYEINLLPVEVVSRDKFLAGSFDIPSGWDSLEMEFVGPGGENLGKYGQLLGGGSTKVYENVTDILSENDVSSGGQSATRKVWFVKDAANARKINFYTCFNSIGQAEIKLYLGGSSTVVGSIPHELTEAQDFAETIEYVDAWVKGGSFYLPDPTQPPGLMSAPMAMAQARVAKELASAISPAPA